MTQTIKHRVVLFFMAVSFLTYSQKKPAKIWATAIFNKTNVMLGEPLVVTVTVYTSTWFTAPPIFNEIQVKGALMVKLETRNSASSVTIARKQYPAIKQQFVVYPNAIGKNVLPSFKITTTCPPEGDYKGRERDILTKERNFIVSAPPNGIDTKKWLTAYDVKIKDRWNKPLKALKAGDVLERRISIYATGALAALVPPLTIDSIDFGTTYFKTPILNNRQNKSNFSGTRTEIINYLIEKDGEFIIPPVSLNWFSIYSKTLKTSDISAIPISVAANPDLEFILSRQKELQAELAATQAENTLNSSNAFSIYGLNWWQLILVFSSFILILKFIVQILSKLKKEHRKKNELESEVHYFKTLISIINEGHSDRIITQLFFWYDRFRPHRFRPELRDLISKTDATQLVKALSNLEVEVYKNDNLKHIVVEREKLSKTIKALRQKVFKIHHKKALQHWMNINPQH